MTTASPSPDPMPDGCSTARSPLHVPVALPISHLPNGKRQNQNISIFIEIPIRAPRHFGLAISATIALYLRNAKKGTFTAVEDEEADIAALTTHAETPPPTVTPISPQLDRFDDATFTWAGILGADADVPADVREMDIYDIPQSRAASWFGSRTQW